jgi:hypothetical protein
MTVAELRKALEHFGPGREVQIVYLGGYSNIYKLDQAGDGPVELHSAAIAVELLEYE